MTSLLTVIIPVKSIEYARLQIAELHNQVDAIELRLDYLPTLHIDALTDLLSSIDMPYIITLRSVSQGGCFQDSEEKRLACLKKIMLLNPDFLDIEADVGADFISQLHALSPATKLICSTHDFYNTPNELDNLLDSMQHPAISIYKIITQANTSLDALRMMTWIQSKSQQYNIVGHCMGAHGKISRIAGPVIGNYFIYAALDADNAVISDQVTVTEFNTIYFIRSKNIKTKLFALIGNPVERSIGHKFHNEYFNKNNINGLYIKIQLTEEELQTFFTYCYALPFLGVSVTMPLKIAVLPFVNNQSGIEAVNTLKIANENIDAINTDGIAALDCIEEKSKVADKKILVLGAGGAAAAIVAEATHRNAHVYIANRTTINATQLAKHYAATVIEFGSASDKQFDIIINTIPSAAYDNPHIKHWLINTLKTHPLVMDANYNQDKNLLLELCNQCQCDLITGENMFINQALAQLSFWLNK